MDERKHLRLEGRTEARPYTSPQSGGGGAFERPPRDRALHAAELKKQFDAMCAAAGQLGLTGSDLVQVTYLLQPHALEQVKSLERLKSGICLLNVVSNDQLVRATVGVPLNKLGIVESILTKYATDPNSKRPKHQDLVENIDSIHLATIEDHWTDSLPFPASDEVIWWEVWLHESTSADRAKTWRAFTQATTAVGMRHRERTVHFPDRVVGLIHGSVKHWLQDQRLILRVAELRKAKELAEEYVSVEPRFQGELVREIVSRIDAPPAGAPAVCLLDTGVAYGHPLLAPAITERDALALNPAWGSVGSDSHATEMAGVALFGCDLAELMTSHNRIELSHRLESVRLVNFDQPHEPDSYGSVTQEAVGKAAVAAPHRKRVLCLTITADCRDAGLPSTWSASIDQLCFGGELFGEPKLLCVAAGNLREHIQDSEFSYPVIEGDAAGIEDPAQAWNALSVGAITHKIMIQDPTVAGYQPIAPVGDLSPTSRTSWAWPEGAREGWPIKPEVVAEGGNWARTSGGAPGDVEDLGILTSTNSKNGALLAATRDTSPATALVARMAAQLVSDYPEFWPETIRALIVHSAHWTDAMKKRIRGKTKGEIEKRLRCYGYGEPNLERARRNAETTATIIYEGQLQPYRKVGSDIKSHEMHLHRLPWPKEFLLALGEEEVTMRVTLSYFIDPSPGRRGWTRRHRYASHGLRFDVQRRTETLPKFLDRVSRAAEDVGESSQTLAVEETDADALPWVIGAKGRTPGSLHNDHWKGTAAQIANCEHLVVFPVTGWWRERPQLERWGDAARYSLVISLETEAADIYSAVAAQVQVPIEVRA